MALLRPPRVAYALLGCYVTAERLLRQGAEARDSAAGASDRGTTRAVGRAFGLSALVLGVAPLLNRGGIGRRDDARVAWSGVVLMGAGLALRVWAARTLGTFYTRTLRTGAGQRVVTEGPYRLVRHPGYLGGLLLWLGAGLSAGNWLAAATIVTTMLRAYRGRIDAEEAMLSAAFGDDYARFRAHTWRLIPFAY